MKTALDKKDYEAALTALGQIKSTITTEDQQVQFITLSHWLKMKLVDADASDKKAAEALTALRAMGLTR